MSEQQGDKTTAQPAPSTAQTPSAEGTPLTELMASAPTQTAKGPDLERDALRAAEQALADGQRALAAARAHLGGDGDEQRRMRRRELLLRGALIFNVLAMIAVAMLPAPTGKTKVAEHTNEPAAHTQPAPRGPSSAEAAFREPWNRALAAADRRDFAQATTILEQYLADSPRMAASQQLNVLMALAHYSARLGKFDQAQEYQRRADAIDKSHSLPEDLVAMAKAAAASGDQESLRRIWARFLLQQRQVPSWLYKHVAEAYLQLGDSYRLEANAAAEKDRVGELERTAAELRARAEDGKEGGK